MSDVKPKVLVLDEDLLSLELYSRELCGDYQVTTSESVQHTRQCLTRIKFDALIIEPAVDDGWTLLREIRSVDNPPLVILCSVEDDRVAGLSQGAYAFLVKPVLPATLHALLNQIVSRKPLQSV